MLALVFAKSTDAALFFAYSKFELTIKALKLAPVVALESFALRPGQFDEMFEDLADLC